MILDTLDIVNVTGLLENKIAELREEIKVESDMVVMEEKISECAGYEQTLLKFQVED